MPFSLYHGRWDEILSASTERMIECEAYMMGAELRNGRAQRHDYVLTDAIAEEAQPGDQALYDIVTLCREMGVEPVFVALPGHASQKEQMAMNRAGMIAQELGVPFVEMMRADVIDYETDCYDEAGHLNPDGSSKASAYLGAWLKENFDLEDKRGQSAYAYWDENLKTYEAFRRTLWE